MLSRRTRIVLAVLVVASLTFIILDLRGGRGPFASARNAASGAVGVGESAASAVFRPFLGIRDWWGTWGDQRARIAELETENQRLRSLVERSADDRSRAEALDGLLRVSGVGQYRVVPAEVVSIGPAQQFAWTVTIDAGSADGIQRDMSVINGDGLVGRIQSVSRGSATVVLLVDPSVSVGARVAGSSEVGILSGTGRQDSLEFQLLDPIAELSAGDALVTFGSRGGRPYAPGIPIGEVVEVGGTAGQLARIATVRPFANVSALTILGVVIRPPREDPRDSVLARPGARPVPVPTIIPAPTIGPDSANGGSVQPSAVPSTDAAGDLAASPIATPEP